MQFMAEEEALVNPKKQSLDPSDLPSLKLTASLVDEDDVSFADDLFSVAMSVSGRVSFKTDCLYSTQRVPFTQTLGLLTGRQCGIVCRDLRCENKKSGEDMNQNNSPKDLACKMKKLFDHESQYVISFVSDDCLMVIIY